MEVFAHGALCMCYSGQCALSAVIGGRSGNRGTCAQPCRLPYGVNAPAAGGHPLSLKDANLSPYLQELEDMGVACLKLEGRMKRPEYVAVITSIYRRLLDEKRRPTREEQRQLELAFSRSGFTDGYYLGQKGPQMFGTRPENLPEPKELFAEARTLYEKEDRRTVAVDMDCVCRAGEPVRLTVRAGDQRAEVTGPVPETARNRALTAEELKQYRLEGTQEQIPLLEEVLPLFQGKTPLIIELKAERGNHAQLAEATCTMLDRFRVNYCIESFDPRCILWLKKHRPLIIRGQLSEQFLRHGESGGGHGKLTMWLLGNLLTNVATQPDFIAYRFSDRENLCLRLCHKVYHVQEVNWTIRAKEEMEAAEQAGNLVIFECFDPEV